MHGYGRWLDSGFCKGSLDAFRDVRGEAPLETRVDDVGLHLYSSRETRGQDNVADQGRDGFVQVDILRCHRSLVGDLLRVGEVRIDSDVKIYDDHHVEGACVS